MEKQTLYDYIYNSYGLSGKSIELVGNRKIVGKDSIYSSVRTKDGLKILNHYRATNPTDLDAYNILNEVSKYEKYYGDGTSLLTMLLVQLIKIHRVLPISKSSILKDYDKIIKKIDSTVIDKEKEKNCLYKWISTICKGDRITKLIHEFISENPKSNLAGRRFIEIKEDSRELIFKPKAGFFVECYPHRTYLSSYYQNFTSDGEVDLVLKESELLEEEYQSVLDNIGEQLKHRKTPRKMILICKNYSAEVEALIKENNFAGLVMIIKYGSSDDKVNKDYVNDIRFLFNTQPTEKSALFEYGKLKEVIVDERGVFLVGLKKRTDEEKLEYVSAIRKCFVGDDVERAALTQRINNIQSNHTFDLYINCETKARMNVVGDMIDDVFGSFKHYDKGLIHGGMHYINYKDVGGVLMQSAIKIKQKLLKDGSKSSVYPIDLLENTKAIYKIVSEFMIELIETYDNPILNGGN